MPRSIQGRCTEASCNERAVPSGRGRCEEHKRPPWQGRPSKQARYGISGGAQQKLHHAVLAEEPTCYFPRCSAPSVEVDHIIAVTEGGSRTARTNLGGICAAHHAEKSKAERLRSAERARARARAARDARG
jgi:5-methylcytosine-specific restriction endonuclease McrA